MESMIYYPGFEVQDENWLKFALLYLEELRPIIPNIIADESQYLSPTAIAIQKKTNLIHPYNPDYDEAHCASVTACKEFDNYLSKPYLYRPFFSHSKSRDLIQYWKNPHNQYYSLYEGKYTSDFFHYCLDNHIATPFDNGIKISQDLAFAYMSFLADIISKINGIDMITDISKYNTMLISNDKLHFIGQKNDFKIVKTQIEFSVPCNIDSIPLEKIIELRNDRDFDNCRRAFVNEIDEYLKRRKDNPNATFEDQLKVGKQIKKLLSSVGLIAGAVFLTLSSVHSIFNGESVSIKDIPTAVCDAIAIKKEIAKFPRHLEAVKQKSQTKRYISKIRKKAIIT